MSNETYVKEFPLCDVCAAGDVKSEAHYDGMTIEGVWASMCDWHFDIHGTGLGTGRGQRLILGEKPEVTDEERRAKIRQAINQGDFDAAEELIGDGDPAEYL